MPRIFSNIAAHTLLVFFADIDECASSPCGNGGSCVDIVNGLWCNCNLQYTGEFCEFSKPMNPPRTNVFTILN